MEDREMNEYEKAVTYCLMVAEESWHRTHGLGRVMANVPEDRAKEAIGHVAAAMISAYGASPKTFARLYDERMQHLAEERARNVPKRG